MHRAGKYLEYCFTHRARVPIGTIGSVQKPAHPGGNARDGLQVETHFKMCLDRDSLLPRRRLVIRSYRRPQSCTFFLPRRLSLGEVS